MSLQQKQNTITQTPLPVETFIVSKTIATSPYKAQSMVKERFPDLHIKRYDYAVGYDKYGTQLNHDLYYYFDIPGLQEEQLKRELRYTVFKWLDRHDMHIHVDKCEELFEDMYGLIFHADRSAKSSSGDTTH